MIRRLFLLWVPLSLVVLGAWASVTAFRDTWTKSVLFRAAFGIPPNAMRALLVLAGAACFVQALLLGRSVIRGGRTPTLARTRLAVYLGLSGWALHATATLPRLPVIMKATATLAAGAFALLLFAARWAEGRSVRRWLRPLDMLAANLVVLLVGSEIALRVLLSLTGNTLLDPTLQTSVERVASRRKEASESHFGFPRNSAGYVDAEFTPRTRTRRIVSIADSFGPGVVHHHFHFTTVCERLLGDLEVLNLSLPGIGPSEYLHLLREEGLALEPEAIQVCFFIGNDLRDHSRDEAGPRDGSRWLTLEEYVLPTLVSRLRVVARERRLSERVGAPQGFDVDVTAKNWDEARILKEFPWFADPALEQPTFSREAYLDLEVRRVQTQLLAAPAFFERALRVLEEIVAAAGSTPLYFVLIPDEFQVEDELWRDVLASGRLPKKELERDRAQRILLEWAEERGITVLDLLPALRAVEPLADGRRHLYHLQDSHFNVRGNEVAGRAIAAFLGERHLLR